MNSDKDERQASLRKVVAGPLLSRSPDPLSGRTSTKDTALWRFLASRTNLPMMVTDDHSRDC